MLCRPNKSKGKDKHSNDRSREGKVEKATEDFSNQLSTDEDENCERHGYFENAPPESHAHEAYSFE